VSKDTSANIHVCSSEHGNKLSDSMKGGKFLD